MNKDHRIMIDFFLLETLTFIEDKIASCKRIISVKHTFNIDDKLHEKHRRVVSYKRICLSIRDAICTLEWHYQNCVFVYYISNELWEIVGSYALSLVHTGIIKDNSCVIFPFLPYFRLIQISNEEGWFFKKKFMNFMSNLISCISCDTTGFGYIYKL